MKTISIFQILEINNILKQNNYNYTLKNHDTCGGQSLYLHHNGTDDDCDIDELCKVINEYLKNDYIQVSPGLINPYNLIIK